VIEVSDSTLRYDREVKVPLYARHGVPEIWIVDLQNDQLLVYGSPSAGVYGKHTSTTRPDSVPITALHGVSVDLSRDAHAPLGSRRARSLAVATCR
jgi:Uma2 family endonuclease